MAHDTRTHWGHRGGEAESLVEKGFERNALFQRYPNILETTDNSFQQFNKYI